MAKHSAASLRELYGRHLGSRPRTWQHEPMSAIVARYDRHARLYERHWAPVIGPTALQILDVAGRWLPEAGRDSTILDVGAGTGTLSRGAARRWPEAAIVALDPAAEMLALAAAHLRRDGVNGARLEVAPAHAMPLTTGSVDVAISSFALQLVPDRPAALREIRRVLRPGGHLAYVTWLDRGEPFAPHRPSTKRSSTWTSTSRTSPRKTVPATSPRRRRPRRSSVVPGSGRSAPGW